jgi:hypothetical protein
LFTFVHAVSLVNHWSQNRRRTLVPLLVAFALAHRRGRSRSIFEWVDRNAS